MGCSTQQIEMANKVKDGIIKFIKENGWKEGYRNNMAVDMCCACQILDEDPNMIFRNAIKAKHSYDDAFDRVVIIEPYAEQWDLDGEIEEKMLMPDTWIEWADKQ